MLSLNEIKSKLILIHFNCNLLLLLLLKVIYLFFSKYYSNGINF